MAPGDTLRDLWHQFLSPSPHPSARPQVISQCQSPWKVRVWCASCQGLAHVCVAAGMVQILLQAWVLSTVPGTGSNRETAQWSPLPWTWRHFFHFFFPFLLRLVVGVPHHEKQKYKGMKVGDIDSYQE